MTKYLRNLWAALCGREPAFSLRLNETVKVSNGWDQVDGRVISISTQFNREHSKANFLIELEIGE